MNISAYEYICAAGEAFDLVSLKVYGDERYATDLMQANPEHCQNMIFKGGERLILPAIEIEETEDDAENNVPLSAPWR